MARSIRRTWLGRDALIQSLWRVLARQSLELSAERRIGKSSVIKKMTAEPAPGFVAFYQDLEGVRTRLEFVESVHRQVEVLLSGKRKQLHRLRALARALGGAEFSGVRLPRVSAPDWKRLLQAICEDLQDNVLQTMVFFWDENALHAAEHHGVRGRCRGPGRCSMSCAGFARFAAGSAWSTPDRSGCTTSCRTCAGPVTSATRR